MTRKTYYLVTGTLLLVMTAFFAYQILTLGEKQCVPSVGFGCMSRWEDRCWNEYRGDHVGQILLVGVCDLGNCVGSYRVYCLTTGVQNTFYDVCVEYASWQCQNN